MTSKLDETCAKSAPKVEGRSIRETEDFEESLAESVYEGLSWVSCVVASTLELYVKGARNHEIGWRKSKLRVDDCENLEKGLEKALGYGAKIVEYKILKILHSKLGTSRDITDDFKFTEEVGIAEELHRSRLHAQNTR